MSYPGIWQHNQPPLGTDAVKKIGFGWANYGDSQYATGSRRTILATNREKVTNNGLNAINTITSELPLGVSLLWDTVNNKYPTTESLLGSAVAIRNNFQAAFTSGANASLLVEFDNGNGVIIFGTTLTFPRGVNDDHRYSLTTTFFTSDTLLFLPGAEVFLTPTNDTDFWAFSTMITAMYRPV